MIRKSWETLNALYKHLNYLFSSLLCLFCHFYFTLWVSSHFSDVWATTFQVYGTGLSYLVFNECICIVSISLNNSILTDSFPVVWKPFQRKKNYNWYHRYRYIWQLFNSIARSRHCPSFVLLGASHWYPTDYSEVECKSF